MTARLCGRPFERLIADMTGNRIPDSYLRKFWPVQDKQDDMPADIAAFVRSVTTKEQTK